ncbi:MAG: F-type H+-transporting ATPase subunit delta [Acidobacteriota bacterium]|nr:F-type H+-transporting ATPase subunit delta [Acidobacteriota bacterium]
MSAQAVARRYAVALADVVTSCGEAQEVREELAAWDALMHSNAQLLEVFRHPTISYEQKRGVLDELIRRARPHPTTANLLKVLLQNHRLAELSEVNTQFALELDRRSGVVTAQVTTARPLPTNAQEALRVKLGELTGSKVRLQFEVDDELIGGVVTRIGSTLYDGSVRGRLQQIRQKMVGER